MINGSPSPLRWPKFNSMKCPHAQIKKNKKFHQWPKQKQLAEVESTRPRPSEERIDGVNFVQLAQYRHVFDYEYYNWWFLATYLTSLVPTFWLYVYSAHICMSLEQLITVLNFGHYGWLSCSTAAHGDFRLVSSFFFLLLIMKCTVFKKKSLHLRIKGGYFSKCVDK